MTLTEFLRARIAEDEAIAERAAAMSQPEWEYAKDDAHTWGIRTVAKTGHPGYEDRQRITFDQEGLSDSVDDGAGPHIARFDPARVLAECKAKRSIVEVHQTLPDDPEPFCWNCDEEAWPCKTMAYLALPYADHPDYNPEWRL